eukprot:168182_1
MQVSKDNDNNNEYDAKADEIDEKTEGTDAQKDTTFTDDILDHISSVGVEKKTVSGLKKYLLGEEYDTDGIKNDIDIYGDEKQSNLLEATRYSLNCIEEIKKRMKLANVASAAFST